MKISVLDLGTIFGKIFKTPVLSLPTGPEKHRGAAPARQTVKTFPLTSSVSSFSMVPDAPSNTSNIVATRPVTVKRGVYSPMSAGEPVGRLNSNLWQLTLQAPLTLNTNSFASKPQGVYTRSNPTHFDRPTVQTSQWNSQTKVHSLMQDNCTLHQEDFHEKKKLNKQSPGHGFSDKNAYPIPAHFTTSVVGASGSYQSVSPQSADSQPSDGRVTPLSHLISWSETQSCATEISTEQSSICSWRDDEFDRVNTQRVCQLFADVDELLYEGKLSSRTQALLDECRQWNGHSPHLRILGKQLEAPRHEGFQYFHRMATCTSDGSALAAPPQDSASDSRELCVEGYKVVPTPWALHSSSSTRNALSVHHLTSTLEEEVYEAEGQIWEFFAYDTKEADEEGVDYRKAMAPVRSGVPPVSPHACIRDAVAGEVFDDVWRQVVSVLEAELLHKHWENDLTDAVAHVGAPDSNRAACDSSAHILIKSLTGPTSRGSDARSVSLWPNIIPRQVSQVSSASKNNLNGVMTIQAKPLQQRQHGFSEKTQCDADDRPGPLIMAGKGPTGLMEHSFLSASRGSCALSRRPPSQRRLPKLSADTRPSPSHAVNNSNGILRGAKLSTVTEGMASAPVSAARKQRFPSIRPDALDQDPASGPASRLIPHRGRVPQSRVVSAIHPVSTLPPLREPTLQLDALPRPNTTHTFRSDTPIKRSFTPMEFACHMRSGRRPVTGERSRIGVTGFSMGISSSTANSFAEGTSPQRRELHPSSTEGEEAEGPLPLGTHHQRKAFSRIPAHGKKKLQAALS